MRANTKSVDVAILAIIFGALVLIAVAPLLLFIGQEHSAKFVQLSTKAYCFTLFPVAIVGLRWRLVGGCWFMLVSALELVALWVDEIGHHSAKNSVLDLFLSLAWSAFVMASSVSLGFALLRSHRPQVQVTS